jgi:Heat shock protein
MKKLAIVAAACLLVPGCAGNTKVTAQDLASNTYVLQSINGTSFTSRERTPEITFQENMRVSGQTCNRFMGQGQLKDGTLQVAEMASTMMLCADPQLNTMERDLAAMLRAGAAISLDGKNLTLSRDGITYVYLRK